MMYEKIATLAALSAKAIEAEKGVFGSGSIGERVAKLVRACEAYDAETSFALGGEGLDEFTLVTTIAASIRLEAYRDAQGTLYVGRPYYFVRMSGEGSDRAGR